MPIGKAYFDYKDFWIDFDNSDDKTGGWLLLEGKGKLSPAETFNLFLAMLHYYKTIIEDFDKKVIL